MQILKDLEPSRVFYYFEELCKIPHGSKNTKAISDYLVQFAKNHGLEYVQDEMNNVVMMVPATAGYEDSEPVIIQGHMDMVCEKENDCDIDFEKEGVRLYVDGDFVKAKDTTLGGDDGIAIAYALAIIDTPEIAHPRLEVVITVDEEIGLLGAGGIDLSMLKGHRMLNIDSEEEGIFLTSCAGGMSVHTTLPIHRVEQEGKKIRLTVTGLEGGHSGTEIDKEHANASIVMGRVLAELMEVGPMGILSLAGGCKDNAIPRDCCCELLIPEECTEEVMETVAKVQKTLAKEYLASDAGIQILSEDLGMAKEQILDYASVSKVVFYLRTLPNGVVHMSRQISGLVETSLNLGILELKEDALTAVTSVRSSVSSRKNDLCKRIQMLAEMLGGEVEVDGEYPAWEYRANSPLREQITKVNQKLYGKDPVFSAIHAGLECGALSEKIKDLDCVSFGPNIFDIHTPKERLSISSTQRVWEFICTFLEDAK